MKAKSPLWKKWNRFILAKLISEELDTGTPSTIFKDRGVRYMISAVNRKELGVMMAAANGNVLSAWSVHSVRELSDLFDLCTLQRILKKIRKRNASWWSMQREMITLLHQYLVEQVEYQLTPKNHWLP